MQPGAAVQPVVTKFGPLGKSATESARLSVIVVAVTALTMPTYCETALTTKVAFGNGSSCGPFRVRTVAFTSTTVQVPASGPIVTCWPSLKPSVTHEPPFRRVSVFVSMS